MSNAPMPAGHHLDRFRNYLRLLARHQLGPELSAKWDPSDAVQETLLKAYQLLLDMNGRSDGEVAAWLRRILRNSLTDAVRPRTLANANAKHGECCTFRTSNEPPKPGNLPICHAWPNCSTNTLPPARTRSICMGLNGAISSNWLEVVMTSFHSASGIKAKCSV